MQKPLLLAIGVLLLILLVRPWRNTSMRPSYPVGQAPMKLIGERNDLPDTFKPFTVSEAFVAGLKAYDYENPDTNFIRQVLNTLGVVNGYQDKNSLKNIILSLLWVDLDSDGESECLIEIVLETGYEVVALLSDEEILLNILSDTHFEVPVVELLNKQSKSKAIVLSVLKGRGSENHETEWIFFKKIGKEMKVVLRLPKTEYVRFSNLFWASEAKSEINLEEIDKDVISIHYKYKFISRFIKVENTDSLRFIILRENIEFIGSFDHHFI